LEPTTEGEAGTGSGALMDNMSTRQTTHNGIPAAYRSCPPSGDARQSSATLMRVTGSAAFSVRCGT
jgi:hypothetical protein